MASLTEKAEREYRIRPHLRDLRPLDGVEFGYASNLTRCIGCRKCADACHRENNQSAANPKKSRCLHPRPRDGEGRDRPRDRDRYYDPASRPRRKVYMPVQCHQCANAPCMKVCPVQATWQEKDGIVVVDYNWCIGCRYCRPRVRTMRGDSITRSPTLPAKRSTRTSRI